jgi:hypothetical protein
MSRIRLFHWLLTAFTVIVLMVGSSFLSAVAQQQSQDIQGIPLYEGTETNYTGTSCWFHQLNESDNNVSISSQFYQAQFYYDLYAGGFCQFTAAPDPDKYRKVKVIAGVNDAAPSNASLDIKVYQGGSIVRNYDSVRAGDLIDDIEIDLTSRSVTNRSNNIGIRVECRAPGGTCKIHFIKADLLPADNFVQPSDLQDEQSSVEPFDQDAVQRQPSPASSTQQPTQSQRSDPLTVNDAVNVLNTIRGLFR